MKEKNLFLFFTNIFGLHFVVLFLKKGSISTTSFSISIQFKKKHDDHEIYA